MKVGWLSNHLLGIVILRPCVVSLSVKVALDEGEVGVSSGPSAHGILDLKGTDLYELVDLKWSRTLFKVVPI